MTEISFIDEEQRQLDGVHTKELNEEIDKWNRILAREGLTADRARRLCYANSELIRPHCCRCPKYKHLCPRTSCCH